MTKKKPLLLIYLLVSLVLIVIASVLSVTVGMNLATDVGGGSQFKVKIESTADVGKQSKAIREVLKKNHLSEDTIFVEDVGDETHIVVRVANKGVKEDVLAEVAQKLNLAREDVFDLGEFNGSLTKKVLLWGGVAIICVLLAVFVAGWIRYGIVAGVSAMFTVLHTMLVSASLLIITRLPISITSIILIMSAMVLALFATILALERIRENVSLKHNKDLDAYELVEMSKKKTLKPLIFICAFLALFAVVLACTPIRVVMFSALTILVLLVSIAYSYYFVGMEFYSTLLDVKMVRDRQKLTKNPNFDAKAQKQEKAKAKEKAKKDKEFAKKAPKKAKDNPKDKPVV